jgi:hypothetical protein
MRDLLLSVAALAIVLPGMARAADGACPDKGTPDVLTAFGPQAATLGADRSVYQPTGVTALGMPVSYVVVTKGSSGSIDEIDYRFDGVVRKYSEHYPRTVLQAFDKVYSDAGCAAGKVTTCAVVYDLKGAPPNQLASARITDPGFEVPGKTEAGVLATIKADYAREDSGPVFLACLYGTGQ